MALLNLASKLTGALSKGAGALFGRYADYARPLTTKVHRETKPNPEADENEERNAKEIIDTVRGLIEKNDSRAFAVVHVAGKQRRVTDGDLLIVEGYWPPGLGDRINFEKVLLAGSRDFSLIGRPLVQPGLVTVTATVVAKQLSVTKTNFKKKRRKQYQRINFYRQPQTVLRINQVSIGSNLNDPPYIGNVD